VQQERGWRAASSGSQNRRVQLFHDKACITCHRISGNGGIHGPDLTDVANRLTKDQMVLMIVNGGKEMPAYGGTLKKEELKDLTEFLGTRDGNTGKP